MQDIITQVRKELLDNSDDKIKESGKRFFKEETKSYGVNTAIVGQIAKKYFNSIKNKGKKEIFGACKTLWESEYMEESFIACNWSYSVHKQYEEKDMDVFGEWLSHYVSNWASCDTFCNHTLGTYFEMYPHQVDILKQWARSQNRWVKRGAAVSLIIPARRGKFLKDIFEIADILLVDPDDLVQKGYGWMLKAASQAHQQEVFRYVMENKSRMPRTALRYAIEKMPPDLKKQAMEK